MRKRQHCGGGGDWPRPRLAPHWAFSPGKPCSLQSPGSPIYLAHVYVCVCVWERTLLARSVAVGMLMLLHQDQTCEALCTLRCSIERMWSTSPCHTLH